MESTRRGLRTNALIATGGVLFVLITFGADDKTTPSLIATIRNRCV